MLYSIAWRNIWRSKGKTRITMLLLILSTIILITFVSLITGTLDRIYANAVNIYPGSIHINTEQFDDEPSFENYLSDIQPLIKTLTTPSDLSRQIKSSTTRVESFFLAASKEHSVGMMLVGIEPSKELENATLLHSLTQGRLLSDRDTNAIIIGASLAKKLHVGIGDEISIIGTATDYSFAADTLSVVGIFKTSIEGYDGGMTMINRNYLDKLILSQNMASHIIITPKNPDHSIALAQALNKRMGTKDIEVIDWHTHMSALIEGLELMRISRYMLIYFFIAIIFAVIMIFAILIIFARKREVGIMRALGTTPQQIISIMFIERIILTLLSIIIGAVIAGYLIHYFHLHPIQISAAKDMVHRIGVMEFVLQTKFSYFIIFYNSVIIFMLSMITVIYPILKVANYNPIEAIHST